MPDEEPSLRRIPLGSFKPLAKLGVCSAAFAPRRMVADIAQHEGLHVRLRDCFGWEWRAYSKPELIAVAEPPPAHPDALDVREVPAGELEPGDEPDTTC